MDHNTLRGHPHIPSSPEKASEVIANIYSLTIVTQHKTRGDSSITCVCPRVFPGYSSDEFLSIKGIAVT